MKTCTKLWIVSKVLWSMRVPWARPCPGETGLSYLFSPPLYQLYTRDVLGQQQSRQKHTHKHIHTSDKRSIHNINAITSRIKCQENLHRPIFISDQLCYFNALRTLLECDRQRTTCISASLTNSSPMRTLQCFFILESLLETPTSMRQNDYSLPALGLNWLTNISSVRTEGGNQQQSLPKNPLFPTNNGDHHVPELNITTWERSKRYLVTC